MSDDEELCRVDDFHIFTAEKVTMKKYLEDMKDPAWNLEANDEGVEASL
jgi:hypothetical protein